ncbi:MAG: 3-keto-disaccharide hydrolase [Sphingobacteriaceae bacterium]
MFKKIFKITILAFFYNVSIFPYAFAQTSATFKSISLNDLTTFSEPGKNWVIASDAKVNYRLPGNMEAVKGYGVVVNNLSKSDKSHLVTKEKFGDLELELDFMMASASNSGVYLQGRYEIQLFDSWKKLQPSFADCGGIYQRWQEEKGNFEGTSPVMNVTRAPGLWQNLVIKFRAPKFNLKGEKIANAVFEQVFLNGVLVQEQAQVTGPTVSAMFPDENDEQPIGPIVLQGDHGKVAFKNIRYRPLLPLDTTKKEIDYWETRNAIIVTPGTKPSFIKTFLNYGIKKLTHVLSVGNANQVNYSYNLKSGALFQVWRGDYIDVTKSWEDRGGEQLGTPLGSVISLSNMPIIAVLANKDTAWPDSVSFEDLDNKGYALNMQRSPVFNYIIKGIAVKDSIVTTLNAEGIDRTITVPLAPQNLYCLITVGSTIAKIDSYTYAVDNKNYYIKIDSKYQPIIRQSKNGQELVVKYNLANPVHYTIIW